MLQSIFLLPAVVADDAGLAPSVATTPQNAEQLRDLQNQVTNVLPKVLPAIVAVSSIQTTEGSADDARVNGDQFASGVIIRSDGLILSQYHVSHQGQYDDETGLVAEGQPGDGVHVILHDGRRVEAELLGAWRRADLSLLKIREPGTYPFVPIAEDDSLALGDWVIKPGHPLGYLEPRGVVARLGRVVYQNRVNVVTDCMVTGGDSGGPVISLAGEVVGLILNSGIPGPVSLTASTVRADFMMSFSSVNKIREKMPSMLARRIPHDTDFRESEERRKLFQEVRTVLPTADWRNGDNVVGAWRDVTSTTRGSVVDVLSDRVLTAYGTVVAADGWILTKASKAGEHLRCRLFDGTVLPATVAAVDPAFDLALLKIDASNLRAVDWAAERSAGRGTLVAAPDRAGRPIVNGIVSVPVYRVEGPYPTGILNAPPPPQAKPTGLEVLARPIEGQGLAVSFSTGNAARSGIRSGDVITAIDGQAMRSERDLYELLGNRAVDDSLQVGVTRAGESVELSVPLSASTYRSDSSERGDPFPVVFEHDMPLSPEECGGPVVDLNGKALGITIARGAYGCLAIPADAVRSVIRQLRVESQGRREQE